MPLPFDQIEAAALALPAEARNRLVERFVDVDGEPGEAVSYADAERAWVVELHRRYERLSSCDQASGDLIGQLLNGHECDDPQDVERAWLDEVERRHAEFLAGGVKPSPAWKVLADARAMLRGM